MKMADYKIYYKNKYLTIIRGVDCVDDAIYVFNKEDNIFAVQVK